MGDPALDPEVTPETLSEADWKSVLAPMEFHVLRGSGTERPGTGRYLDLDDPGAYHCAGCANKLYDGAHKFHAGCGWPSFFQEVEPGAITTYTDNTHGMVRVEMRCGRCDGHLGHIFEDAPNQPTGKRHCVNGFALVFVPPGEDPKAVITKHRES